MNQTTLLGVFAIHSLITLIPCDVIIGCSYLTRSVCILNLLLTMWFITNRVCHHWFFKHLIFLLNMVGCKQQSASYSMGSKFQNFVREMFK